MKTQYILIIIFCGIGILLMLNLLVFDIIFNIKEYKTRKKLDKKHKEYIEIMNERIKLELEAIEKEMNKEDEQARGTKKRGRKPKSADKRDGE